MAKEMTDTDIRTLLSKGERLNVECKLARKKLPNLWDTYSAFANTNGGTILLGIEESLSETDPAKRFAIVGVEDADKIKREFWDVVNDANKVSANVLSANDVESVMVDDAEIIAIHVPRAGFNQRPVFINNNVFRGTFKRNHEGDYHCSEAIVRMMIRDSNPSGNDEQLIEYYTMDDIDPESLRQYRQMFTIWNNEHLWNSLSDKDFLTQLGGYTVNRKDKTEGLTMAGLLMFGKGLPVRERFGNLRMDYIDYTNLIGEQRYSDRITYDGRWENNLFQFVRTVLPRLTRELPRPFRMEGLRRNDDTKQHKALREAMTNMIIHADLLTDGILKVVKRDDCYEFSNPGLLLLPVEQIFAGGESKARNQRIQTMFRMIGFGENVGSGFPLIINAWSENRWGTPTLVEQTELTQVKLTLPRAQNDAKHSGNDPKDDAKQGQNVAKQGQNVPNEGQNVANEDKNVPNEGQNDAKQGQNDAKDDAKQGQSDAKNIPNEILNKLTDRQRKLLSLILGNSEISRKEMSLMMSVAPKTIERDIEGIRKHLRLEFVGGKTSGHWEVKFD